MPIVAAAEAMTLGLSAGVDPEVLYEAPARLLMEWRHRKHWPYVKHYYFHLMDRDWGHVTIRICGYPHSAHR